MGPTDTGLEFVTRMTTAIEGMRQRAIEVLVRGGVDLHRISLWSEQGSLDCGVMVDEEKSCVVHVKQTDAGFDCSLEWCVTAERLAERELRLLEMPPRLASGDPVRLRTALKEALDAIDSVLAEDDGCVGDDAPSLIDLRSVSSRLRKEFGL